MRIGIDCRTILSPARGEKAGIGHYTYYLVKHLLKLDKANQYILYFDYRVPDTREFQQKNVEIKYFPFSQYKRYLPFAYSHLLIAAQLRREKFDVFHSPANILPYYYSGPAIVTVHDLAIYKKPQWFPGGQKFSTRILVPRSLKRAQKVIAVSEATKKDVMRIFKIPADKIKVIYEGVIIEKINVKSKDVKARDRYGLPQKYILFVGTLEPRKNTLGLIEAYHSLWQKYPKRFSQIKLVLAGAKGYKSGQIFKKIKKLKLKEQVLWLDYVPHNLKIDLIQDALCFIFPSFYEGFGLPVLEAMKLGVPVITSRVSSLPEVAGKAAILITPDSTRGIAKAILKVVSSKAFRERLIKAGRQQSDKFSWDKCARETLTLYREAGQATIDERERKERERLAKKKKKREKKSARGGSTLGGKKKK